MCKNIVESYKPQITVWQMSFACWITDVINTNSEYVILIFFLSMATVVTSSPLNATFIRKLPVLLVGLLVDYKTGGFF